MPYLDQPDVKRQSISIDPEQAAWADEDAGLLAPSADDAGSVSDGAADIDWAVGAAVHDVRLDAALAAHLDGFSRAYLQQRIQGGDVTIDGKPVLRSATRLRVGMQVRVRVRPLAQAQAFKPQAMALDVVYEDAALCVINKPAGLVVHPAPGNWSGTLMNGLLARDPAAAQLPRAGIVHRLDKDTSGLMVVARTRPAMDALVRAIGVHAVQRQYLALAHGAWVGAAQQRAQWAIGRDPVHRQRMATRPDQAGGAKPACTDFTCLGSSPSFCWVKAALHTGRTHQIRVHLRALGHPLVADALYGGAAALGLQRQGLHAVRLALQHPLTGQLMDWTAPVPTDLAAAVAKAGFSYNPPSF